MINGWAADPLFWGGILAALGLLMWWHDHHMQRLTAWFFAGASACFTIAIPAVLDALAALTATPARLMVLAVADVVVFLAFYLQAIRTHKRSRFGGLFRRKAGAGQQALSPVSRPNRHKPVLTPLVSILAGALGVITFGAWRILTEHASATAAGTMQALAQSVTKVNDGSAAKAIPHAHLQGTYIALIGGFLVLALIMSRVHKRRNGGKGAGRGGTGLPGRGGMPMGAQSR
jgi:hypothetical protein